MSKHSKISLIVAFAVIFSHPVDATAGGFGIFNHCRAKQQTCCPPPTCTPVACAPNTTISCVPCAIETEETLTQCWYGVGVGMDGNGNWCTHPGACKTDATRALMDAYMECNNMGCTPYSIMVYPCPCPSPEPEEQAVADENKADSSSTMPPGRWWGHVVVRQGFAGTHKTRRNPAAWNPGEAHRRAKNLAGNDSIEAYIFMPVTPN